MTNRIDLIRQLHQKVLAEENALIAGVIDYTKEDVTDEADQLHALDHITEVDYDGDENEIDMDAVSPAMRGMFA